MRVDGGKRRRTKLRSKTRLVAARNHRAKSLVRVSNGSAAGVTTSLSAEPRNTLRDFRSRLFDEVESLNAFQGNSGVQNMEMTFASFVETKFIPEHVVFKTYAGQTHYQAILKHLMTPELVSRIFALGRPAAKLRMTAVPDWPYLDALRLCDLTADHVRRLIHAADLAGYSGQTIKHIKNVFFTIVSHAQREGCFHGPNPASLVKLPKIAHRNSQSLTFQETKAILERLSQPARTVAICTITTGMAVKEICDLQWKYVNIGKSDRYVEGEIIPASSLSVRAPWNTMALGDSRSASRNRIIEIKEPLLSALHDLSWPNPQCTANPRFVISNENEKVPVSRSCTSELKRVGRALGIPWLNWQVLRRFRTSIIGEFLPRLGAPPIAESARISTRVAESAEVSPAYRSVWANRNDLGGIRRHAFCFGERVRET
jgi:integrase